MGAPKYYNDPMYVALKECDYEEAKRILMDDYVAKGKKLSSQAMFGVEIEGKNNDFIWSLVENIQVIQDDFTGFAGEYVKFYKRLSSISGGSRRCNFLLKKAVERSAKQEYKDQILYCLLESKNTKKLELIKTLLKQGANPSTRMRKPGQYGDRTVVEWVVQHDNKEIFELILLHSKKDVFWEGESELNLFNLLSEKGALVERLGDKVEEMSPEELAKYRSYLLKDLVNQNK